MPYVPDALNLTEPVESRTVESAALEFRTVKAKMVADDASLADIKETLKTLIPSDLIGAISIQYLKGDDATTVFTLEVEAVSAISVDVFVDGVYQHHDTFGAVGTVLTMQTPPPAPASPELFNIEVRVSSIKPEGETASAVYAAAAASSAADSAASLAAVLIAQTAVSADAGSAATSAGTAASEAAAAVISASSAAASVVTTEAARVDAEVSASEAAASAASIAGGPVTSVNGLTGIVTVTTASLGLGNVDDVADVDKPVSTLQGAAIAAAVATAGLVKKEEPTAAVTGLVNRRHHLNAAATTVTAPASADGAKFGVNPMGQTDCFINWGAASLVTPGGTFTGTYALNLGLSEDFEFSSTSGKWSSI